MHPQILAAAQETAALLAGPASDTPSRTESPEGLTRRAVLAGGAGAGLVVLAGGLVPRPALAASRQAPVPCMVPNLRLAYSFASDGAYSVRTSDQSASSSSATIDARPVVLPWPIS